MWGAGASLLFAARAFVHKTRVRYSLLHVKWERYLRSRKLQRDTERA